LSVPFAALVLLVTLSALLVGAGFHEGGEELVVFRLIAILGFWSPFWLVAF